jgi:hypothetical protein
LKHRLARRSLKELIGETSAAAIEEGTPTVDAAPGAGDAPGSGSMNATAR